MDGMWVRAVLIAAACAACYEPPDAACSIQCTTECPGDLTCVDGRCVRDGETCDGTPVGFTKISVGGRHTCGLDATGTAYCWGDNQFGQLGSGLAEAQVARPVPLAGKWTAIAAGGVHTCALADGVASCWGQNADGQALGMSGGMVRVPQKVQFGLATPPLFTKIVAGGTNTCALGDGQVFCWGDKRFIGVEAAPDIAVPLAGTNWLDISLGADFGCGVTTEGIKCWGRNDDAQAGMPASSTMDVAAPRKIEGLPAGTVMALEAGTNDACAVIDGALWCWGDALLLGGTPGTPAAPARLGTETGWTSVAVSETTMCGLRNGMAYCWGDTAAGETGAGLWRDRRDRAAASVLGPADEIDMTTRNLDSSDRSVCMRTGTEVRCWGDNAYGQLGLGFSSLFATPVEVPAPAGRTWTRVTAGTGHVCGTLDDQTVLCWGRNDRGAIDPATARGASVPCTPTECDATRPVAPPIDRPDEIVAGSAFTCARKQATIQCWGDNVTNRLGVTNISGVGTSTLTAPTGTFTKLLSGSSDAMCAQVNTDQLACWGVIEKTLRMTPTLETNGQINSITSVGLGEQSACLVRDDGTRLCAGENGTGELGTGDTTDLPPWTAFNAVPMHSIATRYQHSCAVTAGKEIACWGSNNREQNGLDLNMAVTIDPNFVKDGASANLTGCTAVAVAIYHSCAVCAGKVWCWGENQFGELGRGTRSYTHAVAVPIAAPPALTFDDVGTTESGGCARTTTGRMFCWGDSWRGEVGTGASAKNLPTPVVGAL